MITLNLIILIICIMPIAYGQAPVFDIVKPGGCPPPSPITICDTQCTSDSYCDRDDKCCVTSCGGYVCTTPVTEGAFGTKPGYCPLHPTGPWVCTSRCTSDSDCRRNYKCCRNRCGALACTPPQATFEGQP